MQRNAGVWTNAFLTITKSSEILRGFGDYIIVQFNNNSPFQLVPDAYVEKAARPPSHSRHPSIDESVDCDARADEEYGRMESGKP